MANLRWSELFKALFLAGFFGYLAVALTGQILVGIPVLLSFAWLCYDFHRKVEAFKIIAWREMGEEARKIITDILKFLVGKARESLWDENQCKICSSIVAVLTIGSFFWTWTAQAPDVPPSVEIMARSMIMVCLGFFGTIIISTLSEISKEGVTDKKIVRFFFFSFPIFLAWKLPKFLIKTAILTIKVVHSIELMAVAVYSLAGMIYIVLFPPFALAPAEIFLMAIGCGLFMGAVGMAVHKVLLTVMAQTIFAKVEAW